MATDIVPRDFTDPRIILMPNGDREDCGSFWPERDSDPTRVWSAQDYDGPTHLYIGARAPDERLARAAKRYGLDLAELIAFRDAQASQQTSAGNLDQGAEHGN
jgi:hypothetical protein